MTELKMLNKALTLAMTAHSGQFRKDSGLPYLLHPLEGVLLMQRDGCTDEAALCIMMLHDTCESDAFKPLNFKAIEQYVGSREVADGVKQLTCTDAMNKDDYIKSFIQAPISTLVVKLYDRYINVEDFGRCKEINNSYYTKYANKGLPVIEAAIARVAEVDAAFGVSFAHQMRYRASYLKDLAGLHIG